MSLGFGAGLGLIAGICSGSRVEELRIQRLFPDDVGRTNSTDEADCHVHISQHQITCRHRLLICPQQFRTISRRILCAECLDFPPPADKVAAMTVQNSLNLLRACMGSRISCSHIVIATRDVSCLSPDERRPCSDIYIATPKCFQTLSSASGCDFVPHPSQQDTDPNASTVTGSSSRICRNGLFATPCQLALQSLIELGRIHLIGTSSLHASGYHDRSKLLLEKPPKSRHRWGAHRPPKSTATSGSPGAYLWDPVVPEHLPTGLACFHKKAQPR